MLRRICFVWVFNNLKNLRLEYANQHGKETIAGNIQRKYKGEKLLSDEEPEAEFQSDKNKKTKQSNLQYSSLNNNQTD